MNHYFLNSFPAPLTIILRKSKDIPYCVTGGLETVAVRMPENAIARYIIEKANVPLAMPSANKSGGPSPTTYEHSLEDMNGLVQFIVDGGPSKYGLESTVINLLENPPLLLRPGSITIEELRKFVPTIQKYKWIGGSVLSPGIKYRHYSPKAKVILIDVLCSEKAKELLLLTANLILSFKAPLGILETYPIDIRGANKFICGMTMNEIAASLFNGLRYLDSLVVKYILFSSVNSSNGGTAIMDRIGKASTFIIRHKNDLSIIKSDLQNSTSFENK